MQKNSEINILMKEESKKDIFNEEKARSYVNYLLENDVKTYNKLIPEIQSLNVEEFEKLFKNLNN